MSTSFHSNVSLNVTTAQDAIKAIVINACDALALMEEFEIDSPAYNLALKDERKLNETLLQVFNLQVVWHNFGQYRLLKFDRGNVVDRSRVFYTDYSDDYGNRDIFFID